MRKDLDDRTEWRNDEGKLHRFNGPAIEYKNGTKKWYINGKYHREDGPSVELDSGSKFWYKNGERHRLDGPAIEWFDKRKAWYINGEKYSEQEWFEMLSEEDQIAYIFKMDLK